MATYPSYSDYLAARCSTDQEKIIKLDEILDTLYDVLADAVARGAIREYEIDSGQSKVTTKYRSISELTNGIKALVMTQNRLVSKCYGTRVARLRQGQNPSRLRLLGSSC